MTKKGWSVDSANDSSAFYGDPATGGSTTNGKSEGIPIERKAVMGDEPGWYYPIVMSFVTCAVCQSGKDAGKVYYCISWAFIIYKGGNSEVGSPMPAGDIEKKDFQEAVDNWNKQNPGKSVDLKW